MSKCSAATSELSVRSSLSFLLGMSMPELCICPWSIIWLWEKSCISLSVTCQTENTTRNSQSDASQTSPPSDPGRGNIPGTFPASPTSLGGSGHGGSYWSLLRCEWSMFCTAEVTVPVLSWCWCWCWCWCGRGCGCWSPCPVCTVLPTRLCTDLTIFFRSSG